MPATSKGTGKDYRRYEGSDLITSSNHERLVSAELATLGIVAETVTARDLGLSKLTLDDVDSAARTVIAEVGKQREKYRWTPPDGFPAKPEEQLDQVLWGLRALFSMRWSGWTATIGKNRIMGSVTGVGEISHGGTKAPETTPDRPSARQAGPGAGVRVGVLDAALSPVPWLTDGWQATWPNRVLDGTVPGYLDGHATFVTGLVLSQAPSATVEVSKVLEDGVGDSWTLAREIVRMGNSGVDILNLSLVCYTDDGQPPMALATAVDRLDPEVVVVAAAGNHGEKEDERERVLPTWPAGLDDVVAVGSTKRSPEGVVSRSGFTPKAPWVDVLTEGEQVLSSFPAVVRTADGQERRFDGWARWSGTSFAAARVSGALAASIQPGRVSARRALDGLLEAAHADSATVARLGAAYLPLDLL
jgi:hypothetical protein